MRLFAISLLLAVLLSGVACYCHPPLPQPPRPTSVRGWNGYDHDYVHVVGEFVLGLGESTHNDAIGVTVAEIVPPESCADPNEYAGSAKVVFKFYRVTDNQTLCEFKSLSGGNGLLAAKCADQLPGISAISVHAINTKDKWVHFELLGS